MASGKELENEVLDLLMTKGNFMYFMIYDSFGHSHTNAEDIYLDFIEKIVTLFKDGKFKFDESRGFTIKTYLGTICTNFIIDYKRSTRYRFGDKMTMREEVDFTILEIKDEVYEDKQEKAFKALKLVEGEEGYLFLEDRLLGLSYEEIASKYEIPVGTVKSMLHRIVRLVEMRAQFSEEFRTNVA